MRTIDAALSHRAQKMWPEALVTFDAEGHNDWRVTRPGKDDVGLGDTLRAARRALLAVERMRKHQMLDIAREALEEIVSGEDSKENGEGNEAEGETGEPDGPTTAVLELSLIGDELRKRYSGADGAFNQIAERDLARYYSLLEYALSKISFTKEEGRVLAAALQLGSPGRFRMITWEDVRLRLRATEVMHHVFGGHPDVDFGALSGRLLDMSPLELTALVDAIERAVAQQSKEDNPDSSDTARLAGIVRQ